MHVKTILGCVVTIIINDYIYIYVNHIYYFRFLVFIIFYLLFDIFRIYNDYLIAFNELKILKDHEKNMFEEIRYSIILIKNIQCDIKLINNNLLKYNNL
jgi:hypothetical protein